MAKEEQKAPVLTIDELAAEWKISRGLAYQAVNEGSIPSIRVGRRILVPRAQLERMLLGEKSAAA